MTNKFRFTRRRFLLGLLALPFASKTAAAPTTFSVQRTFTVAEIAQWFRVPAEKFSQWTIKSNLQPLTVSCTRTFGLIYITDEYLAERGFSQIDDYYAALERDEERRLKAHPTRTRAYWT